MFCVYVSTPRDRECVTSSSSTSSLNPSFVSKMPLLSSASHYCSSSASSSTSSSTSSLISSDRSRSNAPSESTKIQPKSSPRPFVMENCVLSSRLCAAVGVAADCHPFFRFNRIVGGGGAGVMFLDHARYDAFAW